MWTGWLRWPARSRMRATISPPGSSRNRASRAWLSSTGAADILGLLQFLFLAFVFRHFFGKGFAARFAFQDAAQPPDAGGGNRLEQDAVGRGFHHGPRAVLDLEFLAEAAGDDHLAFRAETDSVQLQSSNHAINSNRNTKVCQSYIRMTY